MDDQSFCKTSLEWHSTVTIPKTIYFSDVYCLSQQQEFTL